MTPSSMGLYFLASRLLPSLYVGDFILPSRPLSLSLIKFLMTQPQPSTIGCHELLEYKVSKHGNVVVIIELLNLWQKPN